jgi:nucleoside-diphosphate kinase|tara:strand:+ start:5879 stop:6301 length:423 start_codon:yes stop_codon:yes gene_type:complete
MQRTLSILKPDSVTAGNIGAIIQRFESNDFKVIGLRMQTLSIEEASDFYAIHKDRPFFSGLIDFMTSGPVVVMALSGDNAVVRNRELMGPTNPSDAPKGTIRGDFAKSIDENAVHGSDSVENAAIEIDFFFSHDELISDE